METIVEQTLKCKECLVPVRIDASVTVCEESLVKAVLVHVDKNLHLLEFKILKILAEWATIPLVWYMVYKLSDRVPPLKSLVRMWL